MQSHRLKQIYWLAKLLAGCPAILTLLLLLLLVFVLPPLSTTGLHFLAAGEPSLYSFPPISLFTSNLFKCTVMKGRGVFPLVSCFFVLSAAIT